MSVKWENYVIVRSWLDNTIRIARGKKAPKAGYFVSNEKSHDVTEQAVAAVAEHMEKEYAKRKTETPDMIAFEYIAPDGSRLSWYPPAEGEAK